VPARTGRLEKRIHIEVPLRLFMLRNPGDVEKTVTQNISSRGVKVLTRRPLLPQEQLVAETAGGEIRVQARVVYCRGLPDGHFVAGLQFQEGHVNWSGIPKGSAD
jgi:PilZ domain-containing protein